MPKIEFPASIEPLFQEDMQLMHYLHFSTGLDRGGLHRRQIYRRDDMPLEIKYGYVRRPISVRKFMDSDLSVHNIVNLLNNALCYDSSGRRNYPSAGGIYKVNTTLLIPNYSEVDQSRKITNTGVVVTKEVSDSAIKKVLYPDLRGKYCLAVLTANGASYCGKYGRRALRYIYFEAGHICQVLIDEIAGSRYSCCPVGAFDDDYATRLLYGPGSRDLVLYMLAIGLPAM